MTSIDEEMDITGHHCLVQNPFIKYTIDSLCPVPVELILDLNWRRYHFEVEFNY